MSDPKGQKKVVVNSWGIFDIAEGLRNKNREKEGELLLSNVQKLDVSATDNLLNPVEAAYKGFKVLGNISFSAWNTWTYNNAVDEAVLSTALKNYDQPMTYEQFQKTATAKTYALTNPNSTKSTAKILDDENIAAAKVKSEVSGLVDAVEVSQAELTRANQELTTMDPNDSQEYLSAKANADQAQANYDKADTELQDFRDGKVKETEEQRAAKLKDEEQKKLQQAQEEDLRKAVGSKNVLGATWVTPSVAAQQFVVNGAHKVDEKFILVTSDFGTNSLQEYIDSGGGAVRDPKSPSFTITRQDPTRAHILVSTDWSDTSRSSSDSITNFILNNASESKAEAYRIIETFGQDILYTMGQNPIVARFSGELLKGKGNDWKTQFEADYDNIMRASECARTNRRVYLSYENKVVEGYIISFDTSSAARSPNSSPFSFTMYVTKKGTVTV